MCHPLRLVCMFSMVCKAFRNWLGPGERNAPQQLPADSCTAPFPAACGLVLCLRRQQVSFPGASPEPHCLAASQQHSSGFPAVPQQHFRLHSFGFVLGLGLSACFLCIFPAPPQQYSSSFPAAPFPPQLHFRLLHIPVYFICNMCVYY